MQRYRPDPKKPRQLTPDEARRLVETPIDYSDIPPLGDDFFSQARLEAAWNDAHERLRAIIRERDGREDVPHELDMRHIRTVREIAEPSQAMHRKPDDRA